MATSEESDSLEVPKKTFKCCKTKVITSVVCVNCGNSYHRSCLKRDFPNLISESGDARINCCDLTQDGNKLRQLEIKNLELENELLKKLLKENEEKYKLLLENKCLLEENNILLNKNNKSMEEKIQNYKKESDKDKNNVTKNINRTYNSVIRQASLKDTNDDKTSNTKINTGWTKKSETSEVKEVQISKMNNIINSENDNQEQTEKSNESQEVTNKREKRQGNNSSDRNAVETDEGGDNLTGVTKNEWRTIQRNKKKTIVGVAKSEKSMRFRAAERKAWFYVGHAEPETTADDVKEYLRENHPNREFIVEEIKKHVNNKSRNKAYKVGVELDMYEELKNPEMWLEGLIIQEYDFFRGKGYRRPYTRRQ